MNRRDSIKQKSDLLRRTFSLFLCVSFFFFVVVVLSMVVGRCDERLEA